MFVDCLPAACKSPGVVPRRGMSLKRQPIFSSQKEHLLVVVAGRIMPFVLLVNTTHLPKTQHLQAWVILGEGLFPAFIEEESSLEKSNPLLFYFGRAFNQKHRQ